MTRREKRIELFESLEMYECSAFIYCYNFGDYIIEVNYLDDNYSGDFYEVKKSGEQDCIFSFTCGTAANFKRIFNIAKNRITGFKLIEKS